MKTKLPKNNNILMNIVNSIETIIPYLRENGYVIESTWKSNFNSCYVKFYESENELVYWQSYILRFSDHYCCNHSKDLVMNFVSKDGKFLMGKSMLKKIKENIYNIKHAYHAYEMFLNDISSIN